MNIVSILLWLSDTHWRARNITISRKVSPLNITKILQADCIYQKGNWTISYIQTIFSLSSRFLTFNNLKKFFHKIWAELRTRTSFQFFKCLLFGHALSIWSIAYHGIISIYN